MTALITLPLVVAVVFLELAVGGAFLLWLLDQKNQAPTGFLRLTAAINLVAAGIPALLIPTIPNADSARRASLGADQLVAFNQGLIVVLLLMALLFLTTLWPSRALRSIVSLLAIGAGVATLLAAAVARPVSPEAAFDIFALLALPAGALALGGSNAAMLLGHWYLVTPKLTTAPLQRASLIVAGAVILQIALALVAFARGELHLQGALIAAAGIRLGVGLLMTLGVALAAWWTAKTNTQSSTGLLYVGIGTVLAGEISARVIFFLTGAAL